MELRIVMIINQSNDEYFRRFSYFSINFTRLRLAKQVGKK